MFYDKEIEIWKKGETYKDEMGKIRTEPPKLLKTIVVDVQPYSSEEAQKDYGFTIECSKRIFMNIEDININTNLIKYRNKKYDIVKIIEWDDYLEVMVNGV